MAAPILNSSTEPIELVACSLDDMVDHVMAARSSASQIGEEFLTYLLDMILLEIASRVAGRPN
jgi:hypothetical protein